MDVARVVGRVAQLSRIAGVETPTVEFSERLGRPRRRTTGRLGRGGVALVARGEPPKLLLASPVLTDLTPEAIDQIVAHELGHVHAHTDHAAWRRRLWLAIAMGLSSLAAAAAVVVGQWAHDGVRSAAMIARFVFVVVSVAMLALMMRERRRLETACDLFAVELLGSVAGVDELEAYEARHLREGGSPRLRGRVIEAIDGIFASHPPGPERVAAMRAHLATIASRQSDPVGSTSATAERLVERGA